MSRWGAGLLVVGGGLGLGAAGYFWNERRLADEADPAPPVLLPFPVPPPAAVTGEAPSDDENEAAGRIAASEAGDGTTAEQRAILWTVRNRFRGKSIRAVEFPWRDQRGSDPPFSSARPATDATRRLARDVLSAPQSEDPTGGATAFFEPKMQDVFYQAGELARQGETGSRTIDGVHLSDITRFKYYKRDAAALRKKWSPGDTCYATAGRFEFWGNARLFAQRGGTVHEIVGLAGAGSARRFTAADALVLARAIDRAAPFAKSAYEQQAVGWAVRNLAAASGQSPSEAAGGASVVVGAGPEPSEWAKTVASAVLSQPASEDPTRGATAIRVPRALDDARDAVAIYLNALARNDAAQAGAFWPAADRGARLLATDRHRMGSGLRVVSVCGDLELLG